MIYTNVHGDKETIDDMLKWAMLNYETIKDKPYGRQEEEGIFAIPYIKMSMSYYRDLLDRIIFLAKIVNDEQIF